jgi:2-keto-4-pentenoate hydratase/2-oxohepta-3-ene-1,7-dioic acid hydratase in catechol pathway
MKFVSFVRTGRPGFGALVEGGVVDLTGRLSPRVKSLRAAIAADLLGAAGGAVRGQAPEFGLSDVALLPVIPDPAKILCIGLNYETHRIETKRAEAEYPAVFTRFADSQVAHGQSIVKPRSTDRLDFEGELAVVIGRGGRHIAEENALSHVAGFACYNDGSVRNWQRHTHQFTPGKTFPTTGGFGPCLATPDELGDWQGRSLRTWLNDELVQEAKLGDMIFPLPRLISYVSGFTPLSPGDVIATGTPGGVGDRREPPLYMKAGDVVRVEIEGIGTLRNGVADEE